MLYLSWLLGQLFLRDGLIEDGGGLFIVFRLLFGDGLL